MSKFNYASGLPRVLKQKGYLPGAITRAFGPRYIGAGFLDSAQTGTLEFGEFVEVNQGDSYAYEVLPVTSATTAGELAVIVRDVVGAGSGDGIVVGPKEHVAMSLFLGTAGQKGHIVAILGNGATTPAVAGAVYVGTGATANTVAGLVYASNVNSECITATNWSFASTKFAPLVDTTTTNVVYAVEVKYAG
jgi:hypothetical protein